jgi:hypothetical protein
MSGLMGWRSVLECTSIKCAWMHMATSRHAKALNSVASEELNCYGACLVLKSPGSRGGSTVIRHVVRSYPSVTVMTGMVHF